MSHPPAIIIVHGNYKSFTFDREVCFSFSLINLLKILLIIAFFDHC